MSNTDHYRYAIQMGDWYWTGEIDGWQGKPVFSNRLADARLFKVDTYAQEVAEKLFPKDTNFDVAFFANLTTPVIQLLNAKGELEPAPTDKELKRQWV
jgi:hypothetical protein